MNYLRAVENKKHSLELLHNGVQLYNAIVAWLREGSGPPLVLMSTSKLLALNNRIYKDELVWKNKLRLHYRRVKPDTISSIQQYVSCTDPIKSVVEDLLFKMYKMRQMFYACTTCNRPYKSNNTQCQACGQDYCSFCCNWFNDGTGLQICYSCRTPN